MPDTDQIEAEDVERRMRAGLAKALRASAKPHQLSKAKGRESRGQCAEQ